MTDASAGPAGERRLPSALGYVLATLTAVLLLYLLTAMFPRVRCEWLLPMAVLVAWPLWRYQTDRILFERRAILAAVATPTGRLWRWLWRGRITSVLQVFVALTFAISLLCLMSALQPLHWGILVADALVLAFIIRPVRRMLSSQIRMATSACVADAGL